MSATKTPTASEKRAENREALEIFGLDKLKEKLPLVLACDPELPSSPKPQYRSDYQYLGLGDLNEEALGTLSTFEIGVRLFDYGSLPYMLYPLPPIRCENPEGT
ncbi:MAG: hypothetical protein JXA93_25650 [Anaerolineae bacterium]|nr:hypothetical protein [Anaerolineae bacterium]